jgi:hypothetical protein
MRNLNNKVVEDKNSYGNIEKISLILPCKKNNPLATTATRYN